jgi:hypothetical protein
MQIYIKPDSRLYAFATEYFEDGIPAKSVHDTALLIYQDQQMQRDFVLVEMEKLNAEQLRALIRLHCEINFRATVTPLIIHRQTASFAVAIDHTTNLQIERRKKGFGA